MVQPVELGERIKRILDWALLPISAGVVANMLLSGLIGTQGVQDGWSWNTIGAISSLVITAGAKAYWNSHG